MNYKNIYDINTFQCVDNEVYIGGESEGEDIPLVFNTIELLEWLDHSHMKKQSIKYIKSL